MILKAQRNNLRENKVQGIIIQANNLSGILEKVDEYLTDYDVEFSTAFESGFIWFNDNETGFAENGGDIAIPVFEHDYDEEPTYYLHNEPCPVTIENVTKYAKEILDAHYVKITD